MGFCINIFWDYINIVNGCKPKYFTNPSAASSINTITIQQHKHNLCIISKHKKWLILEVEGPTIKTHYYRPQLQDVDVVILSHNGLDTTWLPWEVTGKQTSSFQTPAAQSSFI